MSYTQYVKLSAPHLQFFCRHCVGTDDRYNIAASLSLIIAVHAPDIHSMRQQAESELNLIQFHGISLPNVMQVASNQAPVHTQSQYVLRDHSPWLLDQYVPVDVGGDGNCLFRAVSFALYGNESQHLLLRLLAAIEVLLYSSLYDPSSDCYCQPYKVDAGLVLTSYQSLVCDTGIVKQGTELDMHTVLALSSVVQKPIQTRWSIVVRDAWESPMTKLVIGHDVQTGIPVNILWTIGSARYPGKDCKLTLNHFVPLIALTSVTADSGSSRLYHRGDKLILPDVHSRVSECYSGIHCRPK